MEQEWDKYESKQKKQKERDRKTVPLSTIETWSLYIDTIVSLTKLKEMENTPLISLGYLFNFGHLSKNFDAFNM